MPDVISAKQLRQQLKDVVENVKHGRRYTVLYRSQPAFDIVPVGSPPHQPRAVGIRPSVPGAAGRVIGNRGTRPCATTEVLYR